MKEDDIYLPSLLPQFRALARNFHQLWYEKHDYRCAYDLLLRNPGLVDLMGSRTVLDVVGYATIERTHRDAVHLQHLLSSMLRPTIRAELRLAYEALASLTTANIGPEHDPTTQAETSR